ncbi:uncharacterized protein LOC119663136 [Teleopsis dalmanni]|uniref:uncharacterized protein LOC119663136 n=1 Tax=Teleopsis dalmanni TaxID=139649 RepID=UPI0018CE7BAF|nr:uncharacterized protein LOC119663136 [Teleopsis dalmanni]
MPTKIITDRGTAFTAKDFERFCTRNHIRHIKNAVRTPRANAHAERTNRTILSMLLPTNTVDKRWDENMVRLQWCLNTMENATTKCTPYELLYGYQPRDILQNALILTLHNDDTLTTDQLTDLRRTIAERITDERAKAKSRYDKRYLQPTKFQEGDLVLVQNEPYSTGESRKLEPRYKGPFIITKVLDKDRYVVNDLPNSKRTQRQYTSVYSFDKIKRWCQLPYDDSSSEADNDDDDDNDNVAESTDKAGSL